MRQDTFRVREVVRYEVRHDMSDSRFVGSDSIGLFRSLKHANEVAALMAGNREAATLIPLKYQGQAEHIDVGRAFMKAAKAMLPHETYMHLVSMAVADQKVDGDDPQHR